MAFTPCSSRRLRTRQNQSRRERAKQKLQLSDNSNSNTITVMLHRLFLTTLRIAGSAEVLGDWVVWLSLRNAHEPGVNICSCAEAKRECTCWNKFNCELLDLFGVDHHLIPQFNCLAIEKNTSRSENKQLIKFTFRSRTPFVGPISSNFNLGPSSSRRQSHAGASSAFASSSSSRKGHSAKTSPLYSYLLKNAGLGETWFVAGAWVPKKVILFIYIYIYMMFKSCL